MKEKIKINFSEREKLKFRSVRTMVKQKPKVQSNKKLYKREKYREE